MFTLGGKTDTELGVLVLVGYDTPILPSSRENVTQIMNLPGVLDFGGTLSQKSFSIPCAFQTTTRDSLEDAIRTLTHHLIDKNGQPRTLMLEFDHEEGVFYDVRYAGSLDIDRIVDRTNGKFDLALSAANPIAYTEQTNVTKTITSLLDNQIEISSDTTYKEQPIISIKNTGATDITNPEIKIKHYRR
jgi:phage-related protein